MAQVTYCRYNINQFSKGHVKKNCKLTLLKFQGTRDFPPYSKQSKSLKYLNNITTTLVPQWIEH
jgi:hypothetical protein